MLSTAKRRRPRIEQPADESAERPASGRRAWVPGGPESRRERLKVAVLLGGPGHERGEALGARSTLGTEVSHRCSVDDPKEARKVPRKLGRDPSVDERTSLITGRAIRQEAGREPRKPARKESRRLSGCSKHPARVHDGQEESKRRLRPSSHEPRRQVRVLIVRHDAHRPGIAHEDACDPTVVRRHSHPLGDGRPQRAA